MFVQLITLSLRLHPCILYSELLRSSSSRPCTTMVMAGFDLGRIRYAGVTVPINTLTDVPRGCVVLSECQRGNLEVL